jgi:hypothetical protein|tara:strand:- start:71 stop:337 length:267 start_codon:yes stop_codon:yes gene_type:complete
MNNFLPNHRIVTQRLNKIELDNFINKCKSLNILKLVKTNRPSYNRIEYIDNNVNYFIAEIIDNHLEYNYIDKVNKQYKINYDLNRISI